MRLVTSKDSLPAPLPVAASGTAIAAVEFPPETEVTAAEIGPKIELCKVAAANGHLIRLYDTRDAP